MSAEKTVPRRQSAFLGTVLRGKGQPRLPLWSLIVGLFWSVLTWFTYPYALGIATWQGNLRYVGVVLLVVTALLVFFGFRAFARVVWHVGLLWLLLLLVLVFLTLIIIRGRAMQANNLNGWSDSAASVITNGQAFAAGFGNELRALPDDVYMAALGLDPPWRTKPNVVLNTATLAQSSEEGQIVLSSESATDGITRGVLARVAVGGADNANLRRSPGSNAPIATKIADGSLVMVTDGPRVGTGHIWWYITTDDAEGWCDSDLLALVSR